MRALGGWSCIPVRKPTVVVLPRWCCGRHWTQSSSPRQGKGLEAHRCCIAQVVKLVDTLASGASARKGVEVQVLSWAPISKEASLATGLFYAHDVRYVARGMDAGSDDACGSDSRPADKALARTSTRSDASKAWKTALSWAPISKEASLRTGLFLCLFYACGSAPYSCGPRRNASRNSRQAAT